MFKKIQYIVGALSIVGFVYSAEVGASQITPGVYMSVADAKCFLKIDKETSFGGSSLHITYASNTVTRGYCSTHYPGKPYFILEGDEYGISARWDRGAGFFICKTNGVCETAIYANYSSAPYQVSRVTLMDSGNLILQNFECEDNRELLRSQDKSKCNFNNPIFNGRLSYANAEDLPARFFAFSGVSKSESTSERNCAVLEKSFRDYCLSYRNGYHKRCRAIERKFLKDKNAYCSAYLVFEGSSK